MSLVTSPVDEAQQSRILEAFGLHPRDPMAVALVAICERYQLDPLLKHMVLIRQGNKANPYITRDGLLHVAHRSKMLDGIEIVSQSETTTHYLAEVAVYRKDMKYPFKFQGRYPKDGHNKTYGPEMAIKVAEVMALRRAFDVTGIGAAEEAWESTEVVEPKALEASNAVEVVPELEKRTVQRIAILAREMSIDRHAVNYFITKGRCASTKELTASEASAVIDLLEAMKDGRTALKWDADGNIAAAVSPEEYINSILTNDEAKPAVVEVTEEPRSSSPPIETPPASNNSAAIRAVARAKLKAPNLSIESVIEEVTGSQKQLEELTIEEINAVLAQLRKAAA